MEWAIIGLSISGIVLYFYRFFVTSSLTQKFAENHGNEYMNFQYVVYWNELLTYMIGWLVFLATIKFLKLLRFNRRISVLAGTLKTGAKPLGSYLIVFSTTFFAFVVLFYGFFSSSVLAYSTPLYTAETLLSMTLGKFDFDVLQRTRPDVGPFMFFLYVCSVTFIMLNMFVSILNESFAAVQENLSLQSNDYEIVDFMIYKFKVLIGKESPNIKESLRPEVKEAEPEIKYNFEDVGSYGCYALDSGPDRISRFLNKLTSLHTGEDPFPFEQFKIKWDEKNLTLKGHDHNRGQVKRGHLNK